MATAQWLLAVNVRDDQRQKRNSRVTAAVAMLNRGWGAPKQSVDIDHKHQLDITNLLEIVEQKREQRLGPSPTVIEVEATQVGRPN